MRGLFITATDTGVGKTYLTGAIADELRRQGLSVGIAKPVVTGLDDEGPHDHELLRAVTAATFGPPVSPHAAAEAAGVKLDPQSLHAAVDRAAAGNDVVLVEGVGGLLVPLSPGYHVRDLASELGFPVVVAARAGLGTINHTLLTLEAAEKAHLKVRAVVLTPWPGEPGLVETSSLTVIKRRVSTYLLPQDGDASELPVERWLGP